MQTTVTKRGQTVIPAPIRKRYGIRDGDRLVWLDDGQTIKVLPIPSDPVQSLRGRGQGDELLNALFHSRKEERKRER